MEKYISFQTHRPFFKLLETVFLYSQKCKNTPTHTQVFQKGRYKNLKILQKFLKKRFSTITQTSHIKALL